MSKRKADDLSFDSSSVSIAAFDDAALRRKLQTGSTYSTIKDVSALAEIFNSREVKTTSKSRLGCCVCWRSLTLMPLRVLLSVRVLGFVDVAVCACVGLNVDVAVCALCVCWC